MKALPTVKSVHFPDVYAAFRVTTQLTATFPIGINGLWPFCITRELCSRQICATQLLNKTSRNRENCWRADCAGQAAKVSCCGNSPGARRGDILASYGASNGGDARLHRNVGCRMKRNMLLS